VRELKGAARPILPETERAEVLAALECVDRVVIYDEATPAETIAEIVPDILVKGADWGEGHIVGRDTVEAAGGQVVRVDLVAGRSTTALVDSLRKP
jgi:D-beta-D-heptose 7-phosphate kinase/D-beta-D-heptose 1-phosphate adenosyltransferase